MAAVLSLLLTAATLLGPMVAADRVLVSQHCYTSNSSSDSVYPFAEKELNGPRVLRLSRFSGKVLKSFKWSISIQIMKYSIKKVIVIVNVATYWGFTYQYHELNALQAEFPNDLAVLAFPCNQFGQVKITFLIRLISWLLKTIFLHLQQEPGGSDLEILNGIRYVRPGNNFEPKMTLFRKIEVNGAREHPLFSYLKVKVLCRDVITILIHWFII